MKKLIVVLLLIIVFLNLSAQLRLPALVRDSMVLQRDTRIRIWGWAGDGERINIEFNRKKYKTITASDKKWSIWLPPMKAGGPYTMRISASSKIALKDILIGDVWICSGQSNMVHQMALHSISYERDIAQANYPEIRHFYIPTTTDLQQPRDDLPVGYWKWANPHDIMQFSAVAFFFAKTIYEKYHVPIGLINASVGGTPIEAWTSEKGLAAFPEITASIKKNKDTGYVNEINRKAFTWNALKPKPLDAGSNGVTLWYDPAYIPKDWHTISIPGYWEDQGIKELDGIVWYRKEIDVPQSMTNGNAQVFLGRIVDADILYVNGVQAGTTGYQYPQRRYQLPTGLLKAGKNLLVVKVTNNSGKGGFVPDKPYYIKAGEQKLNLTGYWQYKVGAVFTPMREPVSISFQNQPTALYNAMIAPAINYPVKGVLWYQGESNSGNPGAYKKLLPALVNDWRTNWQQPDLPFLYAQLPNFMEANYLPAESQWAEMREAQLKTLSVAHTGMAISIDLGEWNDIHPDNKKDVGIRLALAAEKTAYGEKDVVYSGPIYNSAEVKGNKIIIHFNNTGSGLVAKDGEPLRQFAIAGPDKLFVWATAIIQQDNVVVWNDAVTSPRYVRYAWADNPEGANLYNKEGLPASPFRTDSPEP